MWCNVYSYNINDLCICFVDIIRVSDFLIIINLPGCIKYPGIKPDWSGIETWLFAFYFERTVAMQIFKKEKISKFSVIRVVIVVKAVLTKKIWEFLHLPIAFRFTILYARNYLICLSFYLREEVKSSKYVARRNMCGEKK